MVWERFPFDRRRHSRLKGPVSPFDPPDAPGHAVKTTLTLALPKIGLFGTIAAKYVGQLLLADISVPREIYVRLGQNSNIFLNKTVVRVKNY